MVSRFLFWFCLKIYFFGTQNDTQRGQGWGLSFTALLRKMLWGQDYGNGTCTPHTHVTRVLLSQDHPVLFTTLLGTWIKNSWNSNQHSDVESQGQWNLLHSSATSQDISDHIFLLAVLWELIGAGVVAEKANPPPANTSTPYGCQFMSLLLYFWSSSLSVAWKATEDSSCPRAPAPRMYQ